MQPNQYRDARLEKLARLKALGLDVWPRKARRTHGIAELVAAYGEAEATLAASAACLAVW